MGSLGKIAIEISRSADWSSRTLVAQLLSLARQQGMDQATLAARAGISPEALSRLKHGGRCRLTTLLALARAVGLRRLELSGRQTEHTAAALAARKLSAGRRVALSADALVQALTGKTSTAQVRAHLFGFFEELPIEAVHDVVLDEGLAYQDLYALACELGAEGETVEWLQEMAGHGLASPA